MFQHHVPDKISERVAMGSGVANRSTFTLIPTEAAYIHAYMHTCIHAYMHTCIHAYMHTCIHHACIRACLRTYILTDLGHDQDPKDPDGKAAFKRGTAVEEVLVTFIPDPSNGPNSEPRRPRAKSAAFQRLSDAARWLALPVRFCTYVF